MKKRFIYSIGFGISLFAYSCMGGSQPKEDISASKERHLTATDTLEYHVEIFKEISPYFSGTDTSLDTTFFAARYPIFTPEIDTLVRDAIFVDGEHTAAQVAESFLGGFNEYAEEQIQSDGGSFHSWFQNQDCDVMLNVPGFLSLKNTISSYTGGAHGIEIDVWSNYDIQDKQKLSLTDLIRDTTALRQITENYFRKQEGLNDTSSYEGSYFFDNGEFALAENLGLTKNGLLFHYNPYEIKSYAEGPTTLGVPYPAVEKIMTEKGRTLLKAIKNK